MLFEFGLPSQARDVPVGDKDFSSWVLIDEFPQPRTKVVKITRPKVDTVSAEGLGPGRVASCSMA